ncbi:hypothetical protein FHR99_003142 [Litorivivens lipolytica]|uniref:Uncharacterized protein n=1 Tax=Litorivivens lipolytica TaxID=1524264 RepID=A0A7W4W8E6_9GAMM|nr:hypothetical protein [Litorivivens lipolytica]MBB3048868.1 hypothetical protein [Litorivivens lipolytica]
MKSYRTPRAPFVTLAMIVLGLFGQAHAEEENVTVQVGEKRIEIATPPGYFQVTPNMQPLYRFATIMVAESNRFLTYFVPEKHKEAVVSGEMPVMERWYAVQTLAGYEDRKILPEHLQASARFLREHYADAYAKIQPDMDANMVKVSGELSQDSGVDVSVSMNGMEFYPAHEESDSHFSHSMMNSYDMAIESGTKETKVAATVTTALINDRMVFMYVYGEESGLEWTRSAASEWVASTFKANGVNSVSASKAKAQTGDARTEKAVASGLSSWKAVFIALMAVIGVVSVWRLERKRTPPSS